MENLYDILQSNPGATVEELKKAYTQLILKYHPDKTPQKHNLPASQTNTEKFIQVDRAWKILSDPELRAQFDAKWYERSLVQDLPIQETVHIKDFDFDSCENVYTYPCRCGSCYVLSELESQVRFDIVCCETCSLTVQVIYEEKL
ncbi:DPH4 homolog isoform X2 [Physella acuta]|nr:DPH4 homolog isoform X2 [Physella acuta]XP_059147547.1 DPH4 homolog isoform X2 [Physella acuta]